MLHKVYETHKDGSKTLYEAEYVSEHKIRKAIEETSNESKEKLVELLIQLCNRTKENKYVK